MLKKFLVFSCLSLFSFLANASIYQFTGVVDSTSGPDVTFSAGDSFNFTIEVDFSSAGYITSGSSTTYLGADYYAAHYLSGDAVENVNWDGVVEHYYWDNTGANSGVIDVLNNLSIFSAPGSGGIQDWDSGASINFSQDWAYFSGSTRITNNISGYITSITAVPLPAAVWLFGSGLLGLVGVARRKKS